jgi:hypothetical protein
MDVPGDSRGTATHLQMLGCGTDDYVEISRDFATRCRGGQKSDGTSSETWYQLGLDADGVNLGGKLDSRDSASPAVSRLGNRDPLRPNIRERCC